MGEFLGSFLQDLRLGLRGLRKQPGFAAAAILTLALGIGANSAIFSVVSAVLLRPLPFREPERLVLVSDQLLKLGLTRFAGPFAHYFDYKAESRVFEDIAAFSEADFDVAGSGTGDRFVERIAGMRVSADFFPLLGVAPIAGRGVAAEECRPGRERVALVGEGLWRRQFGADPALVGKPIALNGEPFTVIGILPAGFRFSPSAGRVPELWTPIPFVDDEARQAGSVSQIARLKRGVDVALAREHMRALAARLEARHHPYRGPKGEDAGYQVEVVSLRDELFGAVTPSLLVLLAAAGLVLAIACANVANLLLVRSLARRSETAIRAALGAARGRLVRQLLSEALALALLGAALGLLLARAGLGVLPAIVPPELGSLEGVTLDARVWGFTLAASLLSALAFAALPALQAARMDLSATLKGGPAQVSHRSRLGPLLAGAEIALSALLLVGALLLLQSFARLQRIDPGFRAEKLLLARVALPQARYREDKAVADFYARLLERLSGVPGVRAAELTSRPPLGGGRGGDPFSIEGRAYGQSVTPQVVNAVAVSAGYLRALQTALVAGRHFDERDRAEGVPVAIVNQTMARAFWPDEDPLGKRIVLGAPRPGARWRTIVGVVADVRLAELATRALPQMYTPYPQTPARAVTLVLAGDAAARALTLAARSRLAELDPELALHDARTMEQQVAAAVATPRFRTLLLGLFAALALSLAGIGVYGVTAHAVALRRREIGVRVALGAHPRAVARMVLRQALVPTLAGLAVGLAAALASRRALAGLLYEVQAGDPWTYAVAALALGGIAAAASYLPARRAARVDPLVALRLQ